MGSGTSPREALLAERDLYNIEAEKVPLEGLSDDDGAEDEPIEMPDAEEGEQAA